MNYLLSEQLCEKVSTSEQSLADNKSSNKVTQELSLTGVDCAMASNGSSEATATTTTTIKPTIEFDKSTLENLDSFKNSN